MRTVCIVGAGIGEQHLAGFAELPDRFQVKSVCDLNEQRGRALAAHYDGVAYLSDMDAVLHDKQTDIIDICLPPQLHVSACAAALSAGKIVVCEKPLASSLAEVDQLTALATTHGAPLFPVFQYRYGQGTAQLHALIDAGLAGRCYAGTLETHWDRGADYYAEATWRGTWDGEQGGALLGHAIHIHDLLPSLIGPPARVYAEAATRVNDIEVEDCAALTIRMKNGALVTSSVTLGAAGNTSRLRLMFEGFTVESDDAPYAPAAKPWRFVARAPKTQGAIDAVLATIGASPVGYAGMFSAMADALDGSPGREVTIDDARRSVEFVTAAYASARSGQPVNLPLEPKHPLYDGWMP